jgi:sodium transport system permease protein
VNGRRVLLVLQKEVREALRDRRTLFVTLVLPMLLYPGLMIGLGTATARQKGKLQEAVQTVAYEGPVPAELREALADPAVRLRAGEPADAAAALRGGEIHLVVRAAPDFPEVLRDGGTARLELLHDSANESSGEARRKALEAVNAFRRKVLDARLAARDIPAAYIQPVEVPASSATDVASASKRGAHAFGRVLAMMLVIMVVTGAFTPAVDAVAGEKERGTMETLLVCPAARVEVVLGKFLSVLAVSVATALGNLASMGLTFGQFAASLGVRGQVDFSVTPGTVAVIFAVLVPMAALFAALALALSTLARSTKEAQTYLTPLMLVSLPMAMVSVIPNIELSFGLAATPVAGAVLLFRDLLLAQGEPALLAKVAPMVPVVLGATALAAGLALRWAVWMFEREEVLFRDAGEAFSWKDLRPVRREGSVPGPGAAIFLPAAALAGIFLLTQALAGDGRGVGLWVVAVPQGILALLVAAGIGIGGLDPRATLGLRSPGWLPAAGGVLAGLGMCAAVPFAAALLDLRPDPAGGAAAFLEKALAGLHPAVLLLLLAVLPAVVEEGMFRGWVLRGLRSEMSAAAAILLSAVLFGVFHLEPPRIALTGLQGLALGWLALRTGSLWPGVIAHVLHNGLTLVAGLRVQEAGKGLGEAADLRAVVEAAGLPGRLLLGEDPVLGGAGLALLAGGLLIAWRGSRRRDSLPGPGGAV